MQNGPGDPTKIFNMQNTHLFLTLWNVLFKHTNCNNVYFVSHSLFSICTTAVWAHKIQYFSINWRLSGVASRDVQGGGEDMHASHVLMNHHRTSLLCFWVIKCVYLQFIHHCLIGVDFAVVKFIATITSQLYQALTRAMRIIPWFWATTPLRGSWKITSLQSAQVQALTSASRTRCPRFFFGPPEIYIPQHARGFQTDKLPCQKRGYFKA